MQDDFFGGSSQDERDQPAPGLLTAEEVASRFKAGDVMLLGFPADHAVWSDGFVSSSDDAGSNATYVFGIVEKNSKDDRLIWKACEPSAAVQVRPFQRYLVDISQTDQRRRIGVEECFWDRACQVICPIRLCRGLHDS